MDTQTAANGARRALLIGIDGYQAVNQLGGCVNDILRVRDFLIGRAGFPDGEVRLLLARAGIEQAFHDLLGATRPGDEVVFYYSGHGTRLSNPQDGSEQIGALVPVDARLDGTNFLINRDLNQGLQGLVGARPK